MTALEEEQEVGPAYPPGTELSVPGIGRIRTLTERRPSYWSPEVLVYDVETVALGNKMTIASSLVHQRMEVQA